MKKLLILISFLLVPLSASAQVAGVRVCSFPNCGLVSPADLVSSTLFYKLDGSQTPTANQPMGNYKIQMNPTCQNYPFNAGGAWNTTPVTNIPLYGHLLKFSVDGDSGSASTLGAVVNVQGCTTFPNTGGNVTTCSSDLVGGTSNTISYDGTPGLTGFIVQSPQNVTVTIVSAANNGSVDICQF